MCYGYRSIALAEGSGQAHSALIDGEARVVRPIFDGAGRERRSIGEGPRRLTMAARVSPRGKPGGDRTGRGGRLKNPADAGHAAFGKTRVGAWRPRRRAQRGRDLPPRRAHSTYDTPPEQGWSIPVPARLGEELVAAARSCKKTVAVPAAVSAARAIGCQAGGSGAAAVTPITARS